jgi:hypothetical protein
MPHAKCGISLKPIFLLGMALFAWHAGAMTAPTVAPTRPLAPPPAGPPPMGISVSGTPSLSVVTWQPAPNAVSYSVSRWMKSNPSCCRNAVSGLTTPTWTDNNGTLQWSGVYVYAVTVAYANGSVGTAQYEWTRPEPYNPQVLQIHQVAAGAVQLSWTTVDGASYYLLWGPGLADATRVPGNQYSYIVKGVQSGAATYTVAAYWEPGPVSTPGNAFTHATARVSGTATNVYRVSINGFAVLHTTNEDILRQDGAGNEVFAKAAFLRFDRRSGALVNSGLPESEVHGDTHGFPYRIHAGTASIDGGLQQGDVVPQGFNPGERPAGTPDNRRFPFLIWQDALTDYSDVVIIRPTLWEFNGDTRARNLWAQRAVPSDPSTVFNRYSHDVDLPGLQLKHYGDVMLRGDSLQSGMDRPIGMLGDPVDPAALIDYAIILTREKVEEQLAGKPWTILSLHLVDDPGFGGGDYLMFILVERVQ